MNHHTRIIYNQGKEIVLPVIWDIQKGEKLFINQDQTAIELTVTERSHSITLIGNSSARTLTLWAE